jgi:hypothetical protein
MGKPTYMGAPRAAALRSSSVICDLRGGGLLFLRPPACGLESGVGRWEGLRCVLSAFRWPRPSISAIDPPRPPAQAHFPVKRPRGGRARPQVPPQANHRPRPRPAGDLGGREQDTKPAPAGWEYLLVKGP